MIIDVAFRRMRRYHGKYFSHTIQDRRRAEFCRFILTALKHSDEFIIQKNSTINSYYYCSKCKINFEFSFYSANDQFKIYVSDDDDENILDAVMITDKCSDEIFLYNYRLALCSKYRNLG